MYVAATRGRVEAEAGLVYVATMRSPQQRNVNVISWQRHEDEAAPVTRSCVRFNVEGVDLSSQHYNL